MKDQKIKRIFLGIFILALLFIGWKNNQMRNRPIQKITEQTDEDTKTTIESQDIDFEKETKSEDGTKEESLIFIHITGEVRNEGLYKLEEGARLDDLVKLAGGLKKDADMRKINLSQKLVDQMRIHIYKVGDEELSTNIIGDVIENSNNTENKVNINEDSIEILVTLPGIGENRAQKIIEYREKNRFNNIDDLKNISGIGDKIIEQIRDLIVFQ